ncbi:MATE family efflux transporter [Paenibacillus sp. 19GGS1-52]|uniref:MATE family efflux transporter n=1 Tax=Paenibacillus sp. 19GGS1-52 TaxID=2758563 RepID=UPI001EFAA11F|nr:MATE family efflux transporter [Paenibacillus sp. 19GGS1-52]
MISDQAFIATNKLSLWHLSWPIAVEMLLQFLMGTVDSMMVSRLGDYEVSAVGLSNGIITSVMTVFFLVNAGTGIVVSRKWGAGKQQEARKATYMALKINLVAGIGISTLLCLSAEPLLKLMKSPPEVLPYATTYLSIVGAGMLITVLNLTISSVIRSTGNTRGTMYVAIGMNLMHLLLNYGLIFGKLGFPQLGLQGAAISTVGSKCIALLFCVYILYLTFKPHLHWREWLGFDKPLLKEIMSIGMPSIFISMSWGASQIVVISIVSSMGALPLAAYTYLNLIQQLPFTIGQAFGSAVQIQVGQLYGAGRYQAVFRSPYAGSRVGVLGSFGASLLIWITAKPLLGLFTSDLDVVHKALPIFMLCLLWQPLRIWTFTLTGALTAVGEAKFVAVISVLGMWMTQTGGAFLFGISCGWGILGVYTAFFVDEVFRAVCATLRWRQRRMLPPAGGGLLHKDEIITSL